VRGGPSCVNARAVGERVYESIRDVVAGTKNSNVLLLGGMRSYD
jgi:hypothetical protein